MKPRELLKRRGIRVPNVNVSKNNFEKLSEAAKAKSHQNYYYLLNDILSCINFLPSVMNLILEIPMVTIDEGEEAIVKWIMVRAKAAAKLVLEKKERDYLALLKRQQKKEKKLDKVPEISYNTIEEIPITE